MAQQRCSGPGCVRALPGAGRIHTLRDRVRPRERTPRGPVHARASDLRRRDDRRDRPAREQRQIALLAGAGLLRLALDRAADLASRFAGATPEVAANLVHLALRAHALVARRAPDDLLTDALDLLTSALDFLLSRLPAECAHYGSPRVFMVETDWIGPVDVLQDLFRFEPLLFSYSTARDPPPRRPRRADCFSELAGHRYGAIAARDDRRSRDDARRRAGGRHRRDASRSSRQRRALHRIGGRWEVPHRRCAAGFVLHARGCHTA